MTTLITAAKETTKVEADPMMPAWPTCRGLPTNATPDQITDRH